MYFAMLWVIVESAGPESLIELGKQIEVPAKVKVGVRAFNILGRESI